MSYRGDPLSVRLRAETRAAHDAAQRSGFLGLLAAGRLPFAAYADLAAQHWFVYEALELAASAMADDPVAGAFVAPELHRLPALESDLAFLYGQGWEYRIEALPATTTYCTRLREVAFAGAPGFIAHHYTRYLGDLSGGQSLGSAIARSYRLSGDGHRFFVFEGVDPFGFKARYRQMLDALNWPRSRERLLLSEVGEAYRLTIGLLTELKERWT
ncbi:biliverdin-producing heme oxygenase [Actinoplanes sp. NPDC051411]|uniref:biliverdin-producing heme oxygenase n=1 Tax=Actinoplanes sp. NPDC051411 TaxID=3155522 RepID=UPI0034438335